MSENGCNMDIEVVVKCRGCHEITKSGLSGLSWLTTYEEERFKYIRREYFLTFCDMCNKRTMSPVEDFPDNWHDEFWKQKLPYFIASAGCGCNKYPTERMVTIDGFKENTYLGHGIICPVCSKVRIFPKEMIHYELRKEMPKSRCIIL